MPRNFFRRIEIVFPVEDPVLRERIIKQILAAQLADNVKASVLGSDGRYSRVSSRKDGAQRSSQGEFMALALGGAKPRRTSRVVKKNYRKIEVARTPR